MQKAPMFSTPLHHKPIVYGSSLADALFFALVVLHVLPAIVAPLSAIVALATRKGGALHLGAGRWFVRAMAAVAVTGIVIDVARFCFHYRENHTKYAGLSMPSTIPARLAFLFAGLCVLYVLREAAPPRVFARTKEGTRLWLPASLLALGLALAAVILLRLNPWNGSLTMIVSFCALIVVTMRSASPESSDRARAVARHRIGMTFLGAFSWWGALQGFGPAIAIALKGPDMSTAPYLGDRPGPYAPYVLFFLIGWVPLLGLAAFLVRRYRLRRAALATAPAVAAP